MTRRRADATWVRDVRSREEEYVVVPLAVGDIVERAFTVDPAALAAPHRFADGSSFDHARAYDLPIIDGARMFAYVASLFAGPVHPHLGTLKRWSIAYRQPLLAGERAVLRLEVMRVSVAAGLVYCNFWISAGP